MPKGGDAERKVLGFEREYELIEVDMHMNKLFFFTKNRYENCYNDGRYTRGPAPRQPGNRFRFRSRW